MKKLAFILSIVLILALTACGSGASNQVSPTSNTQNGPAAGELPVTTRLILGTLKLEGTENAVNAEQAAELLPLWQTMQVLSESDTAAEQETKALVAQIRETMTGEQMQIITDLSLTREDMMSIMQEQGLALGGGPADGQNSSTQNGNSSNNSGRNFGPGGGMPPPEGGMPGGGPGMSTGGQGQNLSAEQIATAQASRQQRSGNDVPPMLINALIEYLQEKAGS